MALVKTAAYSLNKEYDEIAKATGVGTALLESLDLEKDCIVREIRLHLSAAATQEDFTTTLDSGDGVAYDVNLFTWDMSADADGNAGVVTDLVWRPESDVLIDKLDKLTIAWVNTDAVTWGLTVIYSY